MNKTSIHVITLYLLIFVLPALFLAPSSTYAEGPLNFTADHIEYLAQTNIYHARGSVEILFEEAKLNADEMHFNDNTSDAVIIGHVVYEDPDSVIKAERIDLNLKTKLGTVYNGYTFYKTHNFHLQGGDIQKTGDQTFRLDRATLTTCDADPPEWHIAAKDIKATKDKSLSAWHTTFNVMNLPILYTPYFWVPLKKDRQTGFLLPSYGYSSERGNYIKQGFFWTIKENQDATFYLDYYGEKGFAEGLDYRYIITPEINGEIWMYSVRDDNPSRNLFEIKSYNNYQLPNDISGYLKVHSVSHHDYYEVMDSTSHNRIGLLSWDRDPFGFTSEERLQKYLESNLQVTKPFNGGRTYLLGQYRRNLEGSSRLIPQPLPEIGFILNTRSKKLLSFNMAAKASNFWREDEQRGQRIDINPRLYLSMGRLINLTQSIGLRETSYFLNSPVLNKSRFIADFGTSASTKFFKRYSSFIHLVEPSVEYAYIPHVDNDNIPFFDSIDEIDQTSSISYALTNRFTGFDSYNLEARFRLSQSYNFLDVEKEFSPLLAEATLTSDRLDLSVNASYDVHDDNVGETIASLGVKGKKGHFKVGKSFRRVTDLDQYTLEVGIYSPIELLHITLPVDFTGKLWYDVDGDDIQELNVTSRYTRQCWGFSVTFNKRPDEYQLIFAVELKGLGSVKLGSI